HTRMISVIALFKDGRQVVTGSDHIMRMWNVEKGPLMVTPLVKHTRWVLSMCFSSDGKRLASGSRDEPIIIWDAETGAVLSKLQG
ncbi:WD40-repeat-containing domain protein, partial [Suillus spraguei]